MKLVQHVVEGETKILHRSALEERMTRKSIVSMKTSVETYRNYDGMVAHKGSKVFADE